MLLCSDLEIGDKIRIYPNPWRQCSYLTICGIKIYKDENDSFYNWRRINFKELEGFWLSETLAVYDCCEINKYGIEIIELAKE